VNDEKYYGPACRCNSRRTAREGPSALKRRCADCGAVYVYRLFNGLLLPLEPETAKALEESQCLTP